jgi:hypothetical protein
MVRSAIFAILAGCTFQDGVRPTVDAHELDAPADAHPLPACMAMLAGSPQVVGHLGSGASSNRDFACPTGELPIGFGFVTSAAGVAGSEQSVLTTRVLCGHVARDAQGNATTTPSSTVDSFPNPCGINGTAGTERSCPSGMVLVGITGNTPGNSDYNSVKIYCRPLDGAAVVSVTFADTGAYTSNPQSAQCTSNEVISSFSARVGCTQESLVARCSALACN